MNIKKNVISFINMKGGVGKTTLCKEMGIYLSEKKFKKILIVDIDPQSNCTQSLFERYNVMKFAESEKEEEQEEAIIKTKDVNLPSVEKIFSKSKGKLRPAEKKEVIYKLNENMHIIPGDLDTVFMEREVGNGQAEQRLLNFIKLNELNKDYDYIFIDCPPTYSFYTISASLSSNFYIVPVKPDAYSLLGLDLLERVMNDLKYSYLSNFESKPIKNLGVIFTMTNQSVGILKNINDIKAAFENKEIYFFENMFPKSEKISTRELSRSICDRKAKLLDSLELICDEFERRVKAENEEGACNSK